MNIRKQKVVSEISENYSKSAVSGSAVVVCQVKSINAKELKDFKKQIWPIGNVIFIKNTLFCQGVSSHMKNYKNESTKFKGSHCVVFGDESKDVFQTMSAITQQIKSLKIQSKVAIYQLILSGNIYMDKNLELFKSFANKQALHNSLCLLTMIIPIKICKVIQQQK